ncbi:MAG: carbamoyltransferase N-terminal domain-containing protein [Thermoleophilaceae bacterium]
MRYRRRTCAWWPAGAHLLGPGRRARLVPDPGPDARRRRRRGIRQGRPPAGPGLPRRTRARPARPRRRSRLLRLPSLRPGGSSSLDFSFSGVKTALLYAVRDLGETQASDRRADLAASYQRAIVAALVDRTAQAVAREGLVRLAIGGGVAANSELRSSLEGLAGTLGIRIWIPPRELCTDNAAMIGAAARFVDSLPYPGYLSLDAAARL